VDRKKKTKRIDRETITAHLVDLIQEELCHDFIICEGEGQVHCVEYRPDLHDEFFKPEEQQLECLVSTRSGKQHGEKTVKKTTPIVETVEEDDEDHSDKGTTPEAKAGGEDEQEGDEPPELADRYWMESDSDSDSEDEAPPRRRRALGEYHDDSDSEDDVIRTDYNNPAKTMDTSAPYLQKPGKRNLGRYAEFFPGTNLNTLKKTFEATTQLGT